MRGLTITAVLIFGLLSYFVVKRDTERKRKLTEVRNTLTWCIKETNRLNKLCEEHGTKKDR
jgi:hypothetical protein